MLLLMGSMPMAYVSCGLWSDTLSTLSLTRGTVMSLSRTLNPLLNTTAPTTPPPPPPPGYKTLFMLSTHLSMMKFQLVIKTKWLKNRHFSLTDSQRLY